jgi:hypothetical protein
MTEVTGKGFLFLSKINNPQIISFLAGDNDLQVGGK